MSATEHIIYQGQDLVLPIILKDSQEVRMDLSVLSGIVVIFYDKSGKSLVRFSSNVLSGYEILKIVDASQGECSVRIQSAITRQAEPGRFFAEVKTQLTDTDFANNTFHTVVRDVYAFSIQQALTKSVETL